MAGGKGRITKSYYRPKSGENPQGFLSIDVRQGGRKEKKSQTPTPTEVTVPPNQTTISAAMKRES